MRLGHLRFCDKYTSIIAYGCGHALKEKFIPGMR